MLNHFAAPSHKKKKRPQVLNKAHVKGKENVSHEEGSNPLARNSKQQKPKSCNQGIDRGPLNKGAPNPGRAPIVLHKGCYWLPCQSLDAVSLLNILRVSSLAQSTQIPLNPKPLDIGKLPQTYCSPVIENSQPRTFRQNKSILK